MVGVLTVKSRRWLCSALSMAVILGAAAPLAGAEVELKSARKPIPLTLSTPLDSDISKPGDRFEAVLSENLAYDDYQLPAGTRFEGVIDKVRPDSKLFGRAAYVDMHLTQVTIPGNAPFTLGERYSGELRRKVRHPKAMTARRLLVGAIPYAAVTAADTVPLRYAADWSTWAILPVSLGARMLLGMVFEFTSDDPQKKARPAYKKVLFGAARGTGIPATVSFIRRAPEPHYQAGETAPIFLETKTVKALFKTTSPITATTTN